MAFFKRIVSKKLGELLKEADIINEKQLEEALAVQKEKGGLIGQILMDLGYVKEEELVQALTVQYGFPYLPLSNFEIDPGLTKLVPEDLVIKYCLVPINKVENSLVIGVIINNKRQHNGVRHDFMRQFAELPERFTCRLQLPIGEV